MLYFRENFLFDTQQKFFLFSLQRVVVAVAASRMTAPMTIVAPTPSATTEGAPATWQTPATSAKNCLTGRQTWLILKTPRKPLMI